MTHLEPTPAATASGSAHGVAVDTTPPQIDGQRLRNGDLRVVRGTAANWPIAEDWAAAEGWNPGRGDGTLLLGTDPSGFFTGFLGVHHVSAISIVNYDDTFAFCGMFLVAPELRGRGLGTATWNAAITHAGDRTIGLDAPPTQQDHYGRRGFAAAWRTICFAGRIPPARPVADTHVAEAGPEHLAQMAAMDATCFPADRHAFAKSFATAPGRHALVYANAHGRVYGYGVLRPARETARIGPLYADNPTIAAGLFDALCDRARESGALAISIDVPEPNPAARALAETRGLSHVAETIRMYRAGAAGLVRRIDHSQLYALTSLETG